MWPSTSRKLAIKLATGVLFLFAIIVGEVLLNGCSNRPERKTEVSPLQSADRQAKEAVVIWLKNWVYNPESLTIVADTVLMTDDPAFDFLKTEKEPGFYREVIVKYHGENQLGGHTSEIRCFVVWVSGDGLGRTKILDNYKVEE